jgi:hypothetical protein
MLLIIREFATDYRHRFYGIPLARAARSNKLTICQLLGRVLRAPRTVKLRRDIRNLAIIADVVSATQGQNEMRTTELHLAAAIGVKILKAHDERYLELLYYIEEPDILNVLRNYISAEKHIQDNVKHILLESKNLQHGNIEILPYRLD